MTALLVLALAAPPVPEGAAKPEIGFGMAVDSSEYLPVLLLQKKPVQTELKLSAEQETKVKDLRAKLLEDVKGARFRLSEKKSLKDVQQEIADETDKAIPPILTEGQVRRHRQLVWQTLEAINGPIGVAKNSVAVRSLGFSDDERKKVEEWGKACDEARKAFRTDPKSAEKQKEINEKLLASLTAGQKQKWNELLGEPFTEERLILQPGQRPLKFPGPKK